MEKLSLEAWENLHRQNIKSALLTLDLYIYFFYLYDKIDRNHIKGIDYIVLNSPRN